MAEEAERHTPRFTLQVDGVGKLTQREPKGVERILVEDHVDMIGICEVTFDTEGGTSWGAIEIGKSVELSLGGSEDPIFVGTITGLRHVFQEGKATLTLTASDPLYKLASSRFTKKYPEMTDEQIVTDVIDLAGCEKGTVDPTSETRPFTLQRSESHFHFLRRLAARNGYLLKATNGKVDFVKPQFRGNAVEVARERIITLETTLSMRTVPDNLTVVGWDYLTKDIVEGSAAAGDIDTIGSGTNAVSDTPIWEGGARMVDLWVNTATWAKDLAVAELNRLARGFLRGRAVVEGDGALRSDTLVSFTGHPEGFNPTAYVLSSRHRIQVGEGFRTEVMYCANTVPSG